ncbi:DNA-directed RNA polymerase 1B [Forsythia ovata]|uniref:DNA-directed RNA polymerase 1B n=1 Tax=Forsythia ovata TaxID=205694 RepID=A0ABD1UBJ8_9LAMI
MIGKNKGICHSCRRPGHSLWECPNKHRCPVCGEGFMKWMEVEKRTVNLGRLFFCCTSNCGYFKWSDVSPIQKSVQYEGESSGVSSAASVDDNVQTEDLSRLFKMFARIFEEQEVEISLNVTIRKGKRYCGRERKKKGPDRRSLNAFCYRKSVNGSFANLYLSGILYFSMDVLFSN